MKEEEEVQNHQAVWDVYVRDQINCISNLYRKGNTPNSYENIQNIKKIFRQLKGKISGNQTNKDNVYFKRLANLQKDKYISKTSNRNDFKFKLAKDSIQQSINSIQVHGQSFLKHHAYFQNQEKQINWEQKVKSNIKTSFTTHKSIIFIQTISAFLSKILLNISPQKNRKHNLSKNSFHSVFLWRKVSKTTMRMENGRQIIAQSSIFL